MSSIISKCVLNLLKLSLELPENFLFSVLCYFWFLFHFCNTLFSMCFFNLKYWRHIHSCLCAFLPNDLLPILFQVFLLYGSFPLSFTFIDLLKCGQTLNFIFLLTNRLSIRKSFASQLCR